MKFQHLHLPFKHKYYKIPSSLFCSEWNSSTAIAAPLHLYFPLRKIPSPPIKLMISSRLIEFKRLLNRGRKDTMRGKGLLITNFFG